MNTLAQRRAAHALGQVAEIAKLQQGAQSKTAESGFQYRSYVEGLPATILQAGLGQAIASLLARAKGNQKHDRYRLYISLEKWLCGDDPDAPFPKYKSKTSALGLMDALAHCEPNTYLRAHAEALAYLEWLKKFAAAQLQKAQQDEE